MTRPLTPRERAVLDALLAVDVDGAVDAAVAGTSDGLFRFTVVLPPLLA